MCQKERFELASELRKHQGCATMSNLRPVLCSHAYAFVMIVKMVKICSMQYSSTFGWSGLFATTSTPFLSRPLKNQIHFTTALLQENQTFWCVCWALLDPVRKRMLTNSTLRLHAILLRLLSRSNSSVHRLPVLCGTFDRVLCPHQ